MTNITEGLKKPKIHPDEFPIFTQSVMDAGGGDVPGVFVEIGTNHGRGASSIMMTLNREGLHRKLYTIDICKDYLKDLTVQADKFRRELEVTMIVGNSHSAEVDAQIPEPVVWIFIDGCHCYDCTVNDIETWVPRISPGGLVLFHDCNVGHLHKRTPCPQGGTRRVGVAGAIMTAPSMNMLELVTKSPRGNRPGLDVYRKKGTP